MKKSLLTAEYKKQINEAAARELLVSNTYKQFSNCMEGVGYFGSAKFFKSESSDELEHYQIWAEYANDRGDILDVLAVPAITTKPKTLKEAFTAYYELELNLGKFYNDLYENCDDAPMLQQLLTFVEIQRKSVGEALDFLATLDLCGDDRSALLLFDKELNG
jgi:ferritin